MRVKVESEKAGLIRSIQKTKIMAYSPITSWQIEGVKAEAMIDFLFLGSKITADGNCNHEVIRCLPFGRKAITNLDSDITLPSSRICLFKAIVFPVIMYECEIWAIKKAEHWRIDAFELWCWRRLDSSLDCKGIKQVNPKGNLCLIFTGRTDAEAPILWPPDMKNQLVGRTLILGKAEGKWKRWCRGWDG